MFDNGKTMAVITCAASGHNIRSKPSLKAAVVGMLALGNTFTIQEYVSILLIIIYKFSFQWRCEFSNNKL
jgi:threonine/homoserine efflux transporter RhtA